MYTDVRMNTKFYKQRKRTIKLAMTLSFAFLFYTFGHAGSPPKKIMHNDPPRAGGPLSNITNAEFAFFQAGRDRFMETSSVQGSEPSAPGKGLGPRFNMNSCAACHVQPAVGGTSPADNPQIAMARRFGANNTIPFFISIDSPIREARFVFKQDGAIMNAAVRDGSVHDLFVIKGRGDAGSCNIQQPDFEAANRNNNLVFRIPTPLFGAGLIQEIPDSTILSNKQTFFSRKQSLGIAGHENRMTVGGVENRNGNDGTITRFGWKAQNKSIEVFSGEAYNVEMGVTNEMFQNERDETPGCVLNGIPEDHVNFDEPSPVDAMSDVTGFTQFIRFLAPPQAATPTQQTQHGLTLFISVGCSLCHTPSMKTGESSSAALSNVTVNLYSDLLVHAMGPGLSDNILQGLAGPDEFRTAPLWGVGQRLFFLHDGRAKDLVQAINFHASTNPKCRGTDGKDSDGVACASEANEVVANFNALSQNDKDDLIAFLKSL